MALLSKQRFLWRNSDMSVVAAELPARRDSKIPGQLLPAGEDTT